MISDKEVKQLFRKRLEIPGVFGTGGGGRALQIFRGKPLHLVDNMPPGGCTRHMEVFNKFSVIPEYCFGCYKVLVAPRTVAELFRLFMVFGKLVLPNDNSRKCMVERRDYCAGAYKGFVYCRGPEEGKAVRDLVQAAVADHISPTIPVVLKRGCSEFSQARPEYGQIQPGAAIMEYPKAWKVHENSVDSASDWPKHPEAESSYVNSVANGAYPLSEIFAMQYWLRYAATIGDLSYLKISGKTLPPLPQLKRPPFISPDQ